MKQLFLAIILSLSYANVPAEMYKWVDEEGNVQYTQTPPPGSASATTVTPSSVNSISGGDKDKEENSTATSGKEEAPAGKSNGNPQPSESCAEKSKLLNDLTSRQEWVVPDKDAPGKFVVLSEEIRQQQIILVKAYLQAYCKDVKLPEDSTEATNREATARANAKTDRCQHAREDLAFAESTSVLLVQDPATPDKWVPLTEEKRREKITRLKANVGRFCSK
jgi:Domain of unknown function (DUF4124)